MQQLDPEEPSDRVLNKLPALLSQGIVRRSMPVDYTDKIANFIKEGDTTPIVYNLLLYLANSKKDYNRVFELYDTMLKKGIIVNSATFGPLLEGKRCGKCVGIKYIAYSATNQSDKVFGLFWELTNKGLRVGNKKMAGKEYSTFF